MPFTFAHPAAVVPVQRILQHRTVLSALVIGSMAPDFQNFLPFDIDRADSHSLAGIFWFSLPVGMAIYLFFHLLLKKPLGALLPSSTAARLDSILMGPALPQASGLAVIISLLIGILTHLAWDACTHYTALTTSILPVLTRHLFSVGSYHVYPYKLLQHASSVIGTLLLWHWGRQWLRRAPAPSSLLSAPLSRRQRLTIIGVLLIAPPLIGGGRAAHSWLVSYVPTILNDLVREAVVTAISSFGFMLIAYSMLCHCFILQRQRTSRIQDQSALHPHPVKESEQKRKAATIK
jgi:hypothetical protein